MRTLSPQHQVPCAFPAAGFMYGARFSMGLDRIEGANCDFRLNTELQIPYPPDVFGPIFQLTLSRDISISAASLLESNNPQRKTARSEPPTCASRRAARRERS